MSKTKQNRLHGVPLSSFRTMSKKDLALSHYRPSKTLSVSILKITATEIVLCLLSPFSENINTEIVKEGKGDIHLSRFLIQLFLWLLLQWNCRISWPCLKSSCVIISWNIFLGWLANFPVMPLVQFQCHDSTHLFSLRKAVSAECYSAHHLLWV